MQLRIVAMFVRSAFLAVFERIAVTMVCLACGRTGTIREPRIVAAIAGGARPQEFICDRARGGCGLHTPPERAMLTIGFDAGSTPYTGEAMQ